MYNDIDREVGQRLLSFLEDNGYGRRPEDTDESVWKFFEDFLEITTDGG